MFLQVIVLFPFQWFGHFLGCGVPRAKPLTPDSRPSGATSRPKVGASIPSQRPWLSAAGVNCGFAESVTKGNHEGSASGQEDCLPIMLSKDGASLLQRARLDKLELRRFHFTRSGFPPRHLLGVFLLYRDDQSIYSYRGRDFLCQDNGL